MKKTGRPAILFFFVVLLSPLQAATITNNISGVGPAKYMVYPYFCIQDENQNMTYALKHGDSVDGNQYSGNQWYVGGTLRFGGCSLMNAYLGYAGFNVYADGTYHGFNNYSPPNGVHVEASNLDVDGTGRLTGQIHYTQIAGNARLLSGAAPAQNEHWSFVGFNLSGLEFSKYIDPVVIPNLSEEDAGGQFSDLDEVRPLLRSGFNTVRVPVRWSYLQMGAPGQGAIDASSNYYKSYVKPLLETLTQARIYTIIDMHAYMRYSIFGKQYAGCGPIGDPAPCPDGTLDTNVNHYIDIWTKLYKKIAGNPAINKKYILLDLMNEPVDVPDDKVFTIQVGVIKALRALGFNGYILVSGNNWSGLHSWTNKSWTSSDGLKTYTNAALFSRENFNKAGITDLSKIIINVHQYLDQDFSGTHDTCQTDLTTTGVGGFNLQAFSNYLRKNRLKAMLTEFGTGRDTATCEIALDSIVSYMKTNSSKGKGYGFLGWNIWSVGHGWGDDYNLRVKPDSYHMDILNPYLTPMP